jgi:hypothetical protein
MQPEYQTKRIHYKQAHIAGETATLEDLLDAALNKFKRADDRKERVNSNSDDFFRLINKSERFQGMLFCQFLAFEPGQAQKYIQLKNEAESYDIKSVGSEELSKLSGEELEERQAKVEEIRREFIESILYFGISGNHIVVLQSRSLTTRELETHLAWFLTSLSDHLKTGTVFVLKDKPKEDVMRKILQRPVKTVSIGAPVYAELQQSQVDGGEKTTQWLPVGKGADLLKAYLGEQWRSLIQQSKLEDCLDDANLEVRLQVTYLRKTNPSGEALLRNIATAARHYPDEDVAVELVGGTKLSGADIRLWDTIKLKTYKSLVDEHDLFIQMHTWLMSLISTDEIENVEFG